MNLNEMVAVVRQELHDESSEDYRWTDEELARYIAIVVKWFSRDIPLESVSVIATSAGSRQIDISSLSDRIRIKAVEYPAGQFPPLYQRFELWGEALALVGPDVPDGSNCKIYYDKLHTLDIDASTIPPQYEELIAEGACGYAACVMEAYSIDRVNTGGASAPKNWAALGARKLAFFTAESKRLGYRNKVRIGQLYVPYYPVVSKSTDPGP
jgi:hypothetical protein